jgi:hypothetical protein
MKNRNLIFIISALIGMLLLLIAPNTDVAQIKKATEIVDFEFMKLREGWFVNKFDPRIHIKEKLPIELQSNKSNPFLKRSQSQRHSFQLSIDKDLTPGVDYYTHGEAVRAVAAGIVHFIGERRPTQGDAGGFYVRIAHDFYDGLKKDFYPRVTLYRSIAYRSSYYHLSKVVVKHWQAVKRDQIIGYGLRYGTDNKEKVKLILEERGTWVNPDDYGLNHKFMNYWDGRTNLEIDLEEMNKRLDRQGEIVEKLNSFYLKKESDNIYKKIHTIINIGRYKNYPIRWSTVDKFKYLNQLYTNNSNLFPNLSLADFDSLTKEFYNNQPIVLTLLFK